jgi:hydrogenase maturation protease
MKKKKIGILGIGNLLLSDEGFGVHFVEFLTKSYTVPDNVSILDGGTAGIMMAPFIEQQDILYVVDTVAIQAEPGSIHCFTDEDVRAGTFQYKMSPHQVGLLDILELCKLRGHAPQRTEMLTVVPEDLSTRIGLSATLEPMIQEITKILLRSLAGHDTHMTRKDTIASA